MQFGGGLIPHIPLNHLLITFKISRNLRNRCLPIARINLRHLQILLIAVNLQLSLRLVLERASLVHRNVLRHRGTTNSYLVSSTAMDSGGIRWRPRVQTRVLFLVSERLNGLN